MCVENLIELTTSNWQERICKRHKAMRCRPNER